MVSETQGVSHQHGTGPLGPWQAPAANRVTGCVVRALNAAQETERLVHQVQARLMQYTVYTPPDNVYTIHHQWQVFGLLVTLWLYGFMAVFKSQPA